jgi:hypothetical protein
VCFWKIEELKNHIRTGKLSEKDRFISALIYIVFSSVNIELVLYLPVENVNFLDYINSLINIVIVFVGTIFAYKINASANGSDFLGKYFSIGFVLTVRFLVYLIPILILYSIFYILYSIFYLLLSF